MFPLRERRLIRGCQAHINAGLGCGADYVAAEGTPILAPCDGEIQYRYYGDQGGNWLWFDDKKGNSIQFAHLSSYVNGISEVTAGTVIGYTGNTGRVTTGPHLHIQILNNGVRSDPEQYPWDVYTNSMDIPRNEKYDIYKEVLHREPTEGELANPRQYYEFVVTTLAQEVTERFYAPLNDARQNVIPQLNDQITVLTKQRNEAADLASARLDQINTLTQQLTECTGKPPVIKEVEPSWLIKLREFLRKFILG